MPRLGRFGWGQRREFLAQSENQLYGNLPPGSDIAGVTDRIGRRELAEKLAGTSDHRSRAYRNARDYISRHIRGARRTVKPEFRDKISELLRSARRTEIREAGRMQIEIRADVRVSQKLWRGFMSKDLTGSQVNDYLNALERGDGNEAMSIFLDVYGIGRDTAEIATVREVNYRW